MEQRLSLVTLGVDDLERARRFYEEGLGWRRGNDHAEVAFYQLRGMVLALWGARRSPRTRTCPDPAAASAASPWPITRAPAKRSTPCSPRLRPRAGQTLKPAADTFWGGYSGYFADPDGHRGRSPGIRRGPSRTTAASACRGDPALERRALPAPPGRTNLRTQAEPGAPARPNRPRAGSAAWPSARSGRPPRPARSGSPSSSPSSRAVSISVSQRPPASPAGSFWATSSCAALTINRNVSSGLLLAARGQVHQARPRR